MQRVIYVAATVGQAYALKNLLEDQGIEAFVTNDTLNGVHFAGADLIVRGMGAPGMYDTAPLVIVNAEDAEDARRIALAAEAALQEGTTSLELEALERETSEDAEWPACPHCKRPRLTSCPVCETAGTHFDEAFLPESDENAERTSAPTRLVICGTCDEPFAPRFPARCEWCGHRFADGYEAPGAAQPNEPPTMTDFNARVVVVIVGMLAVLGGIVGWFYYVLHKS